MQIQIIPVEKLLPPDIEMREVMTLEGLDELAASIQKNGVLQPLLVRPEGDGYRIIAGARRFECVKRLQLKEVKCSVTMADGKEAEELKIHENLKREDVDPVEEANYYLRLVREQDWSVDDLVGATGRSLNYIDGRLEMAQWPENIKSALSAKAITIAVARELVKFKDAETLGRFLHAAAGFGAPASVVRAWREKHEAEQLAEERRAAGGPDAPQPERVAAPIILCELCGENTEGLIVEYVPVSQRCRREMQFIRMETEKRRADALKARDTGQG